MPHQEPNVDAFPGRTSFAGFMSVEMRDFELNDGLGTSEEIDIKNYNIIGFAAYIDRGEWGDAILVPELSYDGKNWKPSNGALTAPGMLELLTNTAAAWFRVSLVALSGVPGTVTITLNAKNA